MLGERMEIYQNKLRNPRIIIYSVPEETTVDNIGATIMAQNPEIITTGETTEAKFRFKKKERTLQHCNGSRTTET
jgi:hypothetical protein